jgi:hypothetical protein
MHFAEPHFTSAHQRLQDCAKVTRDFILTDWPLGLNELLKLRHRQMRWLAGVLAFDL